MPLVRINQDLHFYAHVPKCAGTSVEIYLANRFGPLAFENRQYLSDTEANRWTKSSPQHVPLNAFHKIIPESWITSSFAVVRHPMKRLVSAFGFQADVEGLVPNDWTLDDFFDDWLARKDCEPFLYDGHLLPQSDLVPANAAVFAMEDGLEALVAHLDALAGNTAGPRAIPTANVKAAKSTIDPARLKPSDEARAKIRAYYSKDFARFGYDPDNPSGRRAPVVADAPTLATTVMARLRKFRRF